MFGISFKQYLNSLIESGNAVEEWVNGARANASDIKEALKFVSNVTNISYHDLEDGILGSTGHVLSGHKHDSGDLDIAFPKDKYDVKDIVKKMSDAVNGESKFSPGLSTYSFAVPVSDEKKIQVDFMFVPSKDWAKFAYNTDPKSKYKGVIRNQILFAVVSSRIEPGKDLVVKDDDGNVIARASRSLKFDGGIERLFKVLKRKKDGTFKKNLEKVTPDELKLELEKINPKLKDQFSTESDAILSPQVAVEWMFGPGVIPSDINTAEKLISVIKRKFSSKEAAEIFEKAKQNILDNSQEIPEELKNL